MALAGVHIVFSLPLSPVGSTPLPYQATLSQTMGTPGTAAIAVPLKGVAWLLSVSASAPIFYATGPTPDPVNGPRRYMDPANGRDDVYVYTGDQFAWVFA